MQWCMAEFPEREEPGVWIGAEQRAIIQASADREDWVRVTALDQSSVLGQVVEWPVVELLSGELRNSPEPMAAPPLIVCGEVLGFGRAELVGERTYRLGNFSRGLRGTVEREHPPGAELMLLDDSVAFVPVHRAMIGLDLWWRAVPDGGETGRTLPARIQGLVAPPLDGTRPNVRGSAGSEPDSPRWGERWIVDGEGSGEWAGWGGSIATWLDRWHREPVEPGAVVLSLEDRSRLMRSPEGSWEPV